MQTVQFPLYPATPQDRTRFARWFHHNVMKPDGKIEEWGYLDVRSAVAIVVLDELANIALVSQYRYPAGAVFTEIPKGFIKDNEDPQSAARREMQEETAHKAEQLQSLGVLAAAPGIGRLEHHAFLARGLSAIENDQPQEDPDEPDEQLLLDWIPLELFHQWVRDGRIVDAVTIAAVTRAVLVGTTQGVSDSARLALNTNNNQGRFES